MKENKIASGLNSDISFPTPELAIAPYGYIATCPNCGMRFISAQNIRRAELSYEQHWQKVCRLKQENKDVHGTVA